MDLLLKKLAISGLLTDASQELNKENECKQPSHETKKTEVIPRMR
jgi:hypothetical protein